MAIRFRAKSSTPLGSAVERSISAVRNVVRNQWVSKQNQLAELTQTEGVGYDEQIKFMEQWAKEMDTAPFVDKEMIGQVKKDISSAKELKRWEAYRKTYFDSYNNLKTSKISWDDHIAFLQNSLNATDDPAMQKEIQEKLSQAKIDAKTSYDNIVDNKVTLAQNDKTRIVVENTMETVRQERRTALLGGDNERVSVLDIKLQLLQNTLNTVDAEDTMHQIDNLGLDGKNPIEKLNLLKNKFVNAANDAIPFTYNGVRYNSQKDFWKATLGNYVTGEFATEVKTYYSDKNTNYIRTLGNKINNSIPDSLLQNDVRDMDSLMSDPVLSDYLVPLTRAAQTVKTDSAGAYLNDVTDKYTADDTIKAGTDWLTKINQAEQLTGMNLQNEKAQMIAKVGGAKFAQAESAAQSIQQIMASEGLSLEKATEIVFQNTRPFDLGSTEALDKSIPETTKTLMDQPTLATLNKPGFSEAQLNESYQRVFGRNVDPSGLKTYGGSGWNGKTVQQLEADLMASPEYRQLQASKGTTQTNAGVTTPTPVQPVGDYDMNATNLYGYYRGKMPSSGERAKLFEQYGLGAAGTYKMSAQQNTQLLQKLKGV